MIALSLRVPWLPRRALPYIAFVALIADLLSRACDGCVAGEQPVRDSIVAARALATWLLTCCLVRVMAVPYSS